MTKEHKKMYKAGKYWAVATLVSASILMGVGVTTHADAVEDINTMALLILTLITKLMLMGKLSVLTIIQPVARQSKNHHRRVLTLLIQHVWRLKHKVTRMSMHCGLSASKRCKSVKMPGSKGKATVLALLI